VALQLAAPAANEPIHQLAQAIKKGEVEKVQQLLADGTDPNTRIPGARLNYTPLFMAVREDQLAITEALLKAGADPRSKTTTVIQ
jgi:ankyrin repeat protein